MEYISTSDPKDLYATESGNVVNPLNSKIIHDFVLDELKAIDAKNSELSSEERRENAKKFVYEQVNILPTRILCTSSGHMMKSAF